ncbi:MAG TPA: endonuclease/exonuclease/phosphatase family protein [Tepidisphaeraceae bacterium]
MPALLLADVFGLPGWLVLTLQWAAGLVGALFIGGTLLSLTSIQAWWARCWDFPRLQVAVATLLCAGVFAVTARSGGYGTAEWTAVGLLLASCAWQLWRIHPYTPLGRRQVKRAHANADDTRVVRLVISNVLQTNRDYDRWCDVVAREDPDVIAAAEVDAEWTRRIDGFFGKSHPHAVKCPLDNLYGMALWSRLPLREGRVEFIVQDDIPSIHGRLELRDGTLVNIHCLHPRPPVPNEETSSKPRDTELVLVGRRVGDNRDRDNVPTLVFGDLNDVAWSRTTDLFCKLARLLDLRKGRGFYNTFSANSRIMRFPLDHIFISPEFRLVRMRVLDHVGSDHFPVSVTLYYEPAAQAFQQPEVADAQEEREAMELADRGSH